MESSQNKNLHPMSIEVVEEIDPVSNNLVNLKSSDELVDCTTSSLCTTLKSPEDGKGPEHKSSQSQEYPKLKDLHIECIKKYIRENNHIDEIEAKNRLHKETDLYVSTPTISNVLIKLKNEINQDEVKLPFPESIGKDESRIGNKGYKLKSSHISYLKKFLLENRFINSNEARVRLHKETDLDVSIATIWKALKILREQIYSEDAETPLSTSNPQDRHINKYTTKPKKLKDLHLEYLKKYLNEDKHIGNTEARNKLHKETGLYAGVTTVRVALIELEKEIPQGGIELSLPYLPPKIRRRMGNYGFKLKDSHIQCLKKYLNDNIHISIPESMNRLYKETGLKVSAPTIWKALRALKEEIYRERNQLLLPTSNPQDINISKKKGKPPKLSNSHIECLRKYLSENNYIGDTEAMNRLRKETGLDVSLFPIRNALINLRKEIDTESIKLHSYTTESEVQRKAPKYGYKLQYLHIECLRKYLNEDIAIGCVRATNMLHKETGIEVSAPTVLKVLKELREEIDQEQAKILLPSSKSKAWLKIEHKGYKLKELHIECLKKYLSENSSISASDAKHQLNRETGLLVSHGTIQLAITKLRKEVNS